MSARRETFRAHVVDRIMPPGDLLTRASESNLGRMAWVVAGELERLEALGEFVVRDVVPNAATVFLEDWERTLETPGCGRVVESTTERRQLVVEKITRPRNLTLAMIEAVCNALGYAVTVTETATPHQFDVAVPAVVVRPFVIGLSRVGERLGDFGLEGLECLLDAVKPAHTTYTLTPPP